MAEGFLESIGTAELIPIKYQEGYAAGKASMSGEYNRGYNAGYSAGVASVPAPVNIAPANASQWKRYATNYFHSKVTFSRTAKGAILATPISGRYNWRTWYFAGQTWPLDWKDYISDTPSSFSQLSSPLLSVGSAVGCEFARIGSESSTSNFHQAAIVWYLRSNSIDIFYNSLNVPASGVPNPGVTGATIVSAAAMKIYIF